MLLSRLPRSRSGVGTVAVLLFLLAGASSTWASGGRVQISDTRAIAGDVTGTGGDAPGYPVTIDVPGSYVLTSDLVVLGSSDAIVVTSSGVSIDLAGFGITGPVGCSAPPPPISCGGGSGRGIASSSLGVRVHGGSITGFGSHGLELGDAAVVEDVHASANGGSGIVVGARANVRDCTAVGNGGDGLVAGSDSLIRGCNLSSNGASGAVLDASTGYGWTVVAGNGSGAVSGGVDLLHNLCDGVTPCGTPTAEVCDGQDNDLDGQVDEDLTPPACANQMGVCVSSTQNCAGTAGFQTCGAGEYGGNYESVETSCDGLDNDCNGVVDDGLSAPLCALKLGVCIGARMACGGIGGFQACGGAEYGPNYQAVEVTCDSLDNDCDGTVDGAFEVGNPCQVGVGACTAQGFVVCSAGGSSSECSVAAGNPSAETCNGVDDDCDAQVDNNLGPPPSCPLQQGVCSGSVQVCGGFSGYLSCTAGNYGPSYEATEVSCDLLDNDCDGVVDEGC